MVLETAIRDGRPAQPAFSLRGAHVRPGGFVRERDVAVMRHPLVLPGYAEAHGSHNYRINLLRALRVHNLCGTLEVRYAANTITPFH